jgi:hypothetical protein
MKRILAVVSFAVIAGPAFAAEVSAPFEQTEFDRHLPDVQVNTDRANTARANTDRASSGATTAKGPWADDYNFIAPPQ